MDGKALLFRLRQVLDEDSTSSFMDDRTSFDYLYEASIELAMRTKALISSQTITTVADQSGYTLDADFLGLYAKDSHNTYFIKHTDSSSNDNFPIWRDYEDILFANQTTSVAVPPNNAVSRIVPEVFESTIPSLPSVVLWIESPALTSLKSPAVSVKVD